MAVGADQCVGIGDDLAILLAGPHRLRQVFEIDLMADAGTGRHDAEIVERLLAPAQELVALAIAFVFELDILRERQRRTVTVDHHRMVDDQVDRHQRIDLLRIGAERGGRVTHRGEVDHRRHAGEILHQHPRRTVGDLMLGSAGLEPFGDRQDIGFGDGASVLEAQQVLQHHLHRMRQARDAGEPVLLGFDEGKIAVALALHSERGLAAEAVEGNCHRGRLTLAFS